MENNNNKSVLISPDSSSHLSFFDTELAGLMIDPSIPWTVFGEKLQLLEIGREVQIGWQ